MDAEGEVIYLSHATLALIPQIYLIIMYILLIQRLTSFLALPEVETKNLPEIVSYTPDALVPVVIEDPVVSESLIEVKDGSFAWGEGEDSFKLRNISFAVGKGECCIVIGKVRLNLTVII